MPPADWMQAAWTHRSHSINAIIDAISPKTQHLSMPKVPDARKRHGHPKPVGSLDYLGVANRPPGLNDRRSPGLGNGLQAVGEREKGVGGGHGTLQGKNGLHC